MEMLTTALIGLVTALAVEVAKKTSLSVSNIFVIGAVLCAGFWTAAEFFGPMGLTDNVLAFVSEWMGSAALVYATIRTAGDVKTKISK